MNLVSLRSSIESKFNTFTSNTIIDLRSGSERRIHADRRKKKRVDETDRRQQSDRRSS